MLIKNFIFNHLQKNKLEKSIKKSQEVCHSEMFCLREIIINGKESHFIIRSHLIRIVNIYTITRD